MNAALQCRVLRRYPVALIVVTGVLRLDTASALRTTALTVLADRPTALVLDLAEVDVAEPAAATVLPLVAQHAVTWAEAALLLAAPSPSVRAELRRLGADLPVHPTRPAALSAAAARPVPMRVRLPFPAEVSAPAAARRATRAACGRWRLDSATSGRAVQLTSELVTNVVAHAGTDGVLLLSRRASRLHIAVRDGCHDPPVLRAPPEGDEVGTSGLALVAALSSGWGVRRTPDGKVVWATLRLWPRS